jgi:hypothetical protein
LATNGLSVELAERFPDLSDQIESEKDVHLLTSLYRDYCILNSSYLFEEVNLAKIEHNLDIQARSAAPANIAKPLCILAKKI